MIHQSFSASAAALYAVLALSITTTTTTAFTTSIPSISVATSTQQQQQQQQTKTSLFATKKKIFIDGEVGTTGLQVRERLSERSDLEIISAPSDDLRKDADTRKKLINDADAVILCLPDEASIEAASWCTNDNTVLIDASTAFRVNDDWVYGFPELNSDQRTALSTAKRISNPGCYPTGFIALTRPLTDAGILADGTPLTVNAISGYSGGGKQLMEIFEGPDHEPWGTYGLTLNHKHVPEMMKYSGLNYAPIFQPAVGTFDQGMVVSVPIHYSWMKSDDVTGKQIHKVLVDHYKDSEFVEVMGLGMENVSDQLERGAFLGPDALKNTNKLQLFVFANDDAQQVLLMARLDNLGKGASGAAVQNMNIALGLDETTGL